jgi:catechol 2,3-dioxygenase
VTQSQSSTLKTVSIGKVELYVSDLQRSIDFYQNILGFQLQGREDQQAVLGAGGTPLIVLNQKTGAHPVKGVTGLYHYAVLLPKRIDLAGLLYHMAEKESEIQGAADHGVSEALYLQDPDGNGIEMYIDRRKSDWPRDDIGRLQMSTEELDIDDLLLELKGNIKPWEGLSEGTTVGHVHLHVADLAATERFYRQVMGFELIQRYGSGALFFSAGGYHHHIGTNTWAGVGAPPPPEDAAGLRWFELLIDDPADYDALLQRLEAEGTAAEPVQGGVLIQDPSKNTILLHAPVINQA